MRNTIKIILGEMDAKLSGHAGMLNYRFMNLCITAEPVALLSITVTDIEGNEYNLENVADCMQPDEFSFEIVPREMDMLPFIQKGIAEAHPEFKQEVIKPQEKDHFFTFDTKEYEEERHIVCKMPEVDDNRYDFLKESVKTLYDNCMTEVDKINVKFTQMLTDKEKGLPAGEVDEANQARENLMKQYTDVINTYRDKKIKEIEDSHNKWLTSKAEERLKRLHHNME